MFIIAIVEDHKNMRDQLKSAVEKYGSERNQMLKVMCYENGEDLLEYYDSKTDLILMDIDMPFMNGLETAKRIREFDKRVCIIFVTSMANYAIECYKVRAFSFLVKPVKERELFLELDDALPTVTRDKDIYITVRYNDETKLINIRDVVYFEGKMHKVFIHLTDNEIPYNATLKSVYDAYQKEGIIQCHAAFAVNGYYVQKYDRQNIYLTTGDIIPIARNKYAGFIQQLTSFLGGQV